MSNRILKERKKSRGFGLDERFQKAWLVARKHPIDLYMFIKEKRKEDEKKNILFFIYVDSSDEIIPFLSRNILNLRQ